MSEAVRETAEGAVLRVCVTPNAKKASVALEDGRIRVHVTSPALDGKANKAVVGLFKRLFGACRLVSGMKSREKTLLVPDKTASEVLAVLSETGKHL